MRLLDNIRATKAAVYAGKVAFLLSAHGIKIDTKSYPTMPELCRSAQRSGLKPEQLASILQHIFTSADRVHGDPSLVESQRQVVFNHLVENWEVLLPKFQFK